MEIIPSQASRGLSNPGFSVQLDLPCWVGKGAHPPIQHLPLGGNHYLEGLDRDTPHLASRLLKNPQPNTPKARFSSAVHLLPQKVGPSLIGAAGAGNSSSRIFCLQVQQRLSSYFSKRYYVISVALSLDTLASQPPLSEAALRPLVSGQENAPA